MAQIFLWDYKELERRMGLWQNNQTKKVVKMCRFPVTFHALMDSFETVTAEQYICLT